MADVNTWHGIGRLTREASIKYTQSGEAVVEFSIAVNRKKTRDGKENTDFFDVTTWGKMGEGLKPYLVKGKQVAIEGNLRQDRWTDPQGANRSKVYINAYNIQLLGGTKVENPGAGQQYAGQYGAPFGNNAGGQYGGQYAGQGYDQGGESFPEDVPF